MKKEHPLVYYDGMTGDLIKIQLRDGTQYSCTGVVDFLQPILDEYLNDYLAIRILLRGDSGFATPDLYKQCEENGTSYVIRAVALLITEQQRRAGLSTVGAAHSLAVDWLGWVCYFCKI